MHDMQLIKNKNLHEM